jgi:hypothetical protein
MKSLNQVATIAAGILVGAALLPLAPIIAIFVGSRMLGQALQARFHTTAAKLVDNPHANDPAFNETLAELTRANQRFLRQHPPGPASKYYKPPADEANRWN